MPACHPGGFPPRWSRPGCHRGRCAGPHGTARETPCGGSGPGAGGSAARPEISPCPRLSRVAASPGVGYRPKVLHGYLAEAPTCTARGPEESGSGGLRTCERSRVPCYRRAMPYPRSDLHVLPTVPAAAVLTGAAGLVHMAAAVTHMGEARLFGLAFALTGWMQMITAIWLSAGRSRAALAVMSVTNGAALVGWVMSRTVGLPVLHPGVEAAGTADVLTAGLEVLALVAAVALVRGRVPGDATWRTLPIGLAVAGVFALGASATAVAALGSSGGHGQGEVRATSGGRHPRAQGCGRRRGARVRGIERPGPTAGHPACQSASPPARRLPPARKHRPPRAPSGAGARPHLSVDRLLR